MAQARFYSSLTKRTTTTVDPGTSGTTLTVADTSSFSVLDGSFPYALLINWGQVDQEIVSVTARPSGTTFTIVRAQDGTTGQAHAVGATVDHGVSARDFNDAGAHVGASSGVHGVTGSVVGTTDTQTVSNKTILSPVASYSANHTITATEDFILASAAGGSITITLPTAVGVTGQTYTVKRTDSTVANSVTVATTSAQTINGAATYTYLWAQYTYVQVVSDGSNWQIDDDHSIPEPWQAATLAAQWTQRGVGTYPQLSYRRMPGGSQVQWVGDLIFTSNGTTGLTSGASVCSAVPSAYRPTTEQKIWVGIAGGSRTLATNSIPLAAIDNTGVLKVFNVTSVATNGTTVTLEFAGFTPLDL